MDKILVFLNTTFDKGHEADMRSSFEKVFNEDDFLVFQDLPKSPENIFNKVVEEILVNDVILLDGICTPQKISSDILIQYGISCSLNKKVLFLSVKSAASAQSAEPRSSLIENYLEQSYYLDIQKELKKGISKRLSPLKLDITVPSFEKPVHAFSVFGVDQDENKDVYEIVSKFASGTGWHIKFHSSLGAWSKMSSLAQDIGARSFCVFHLTENDHENIFIGIGLAIGLGRPFLVLKKAGIQLPEALNGYDGVLEYIGYSDLLENIKKYSTVFLSDEVFRWKGATYNSLLDRIEKIIGGLSGEEFNKTEYILIAIANVPALSLAQPYALLGDLYRERNAKLRSGDKDLLIKAKDFYLRALSIQPEYPRCKDAIDVLDKHIAVLELIGERKFHSLPRLINLIGENLTLEQYSQVREYLIGVAENLIDEKDFVHAIALLATLQKHDRSDEINDLVQSVLERAPQEMLAALQDIQQYAVELENRTTTLVASIEVKDTQIDSLLSNVDALSVQIQENEKRILSLKAEKDKINEKLENIYAQFLAVQKTKENLEDIISNDKVKQKIEQARKIDGRGVAVNFGWGWGIYKALVGHPFIIRNGEKLLAKDGFVLIGGDTVVDEEDNSMSFIPSGAIVVNPDDERYDHLKKLL